MVVKYYEGIPTNHKGKGDTPQSPSLLANRAVAYNDQQHNCTIGWGRLLKYKPCHGEYPSGIDFPTAEKWLNEDIKKIGLDPLDHCINVPLSAGQVRALVGLIYNTGPNNTINKVKKRGKKVVKILPCQGPITLALNAGHYDQVPALIRHFQPRRTQGERADYEIFDWEGGKAVDGGKRRPPAWTIATAIEPKGAKATITVTPTGEPDPLAGVTPDTTSQTCATTEGAKKSKPEGKCGPYYTDEQVKIKASSTSGWEFVGWKALNDDTGDTRDVCAKEPGDTCTKTVDDQLLRAVAVFKKPDYIGTYTGSYTFHFSNSAGSSKGSWNVSYTWNEVTGYRCPNKDGLCTTASTATVKGKNAISYTGPYAPGLGIRYDPVPPHEVCKVSASGSVIDHGSDGLEKYHGQFVPALSWSAPTYSDPSLGVKVSGAGSICDALTGNQYGADLPIPQGGVTTCQLKVSSGSERSFVSALFSVGPPNGLPYPLYPKPKQLPLTLSYGGSLGCTQGKLSIQVADKATIKLSP
jgi:GH24 family phage-related lysozyme (muramidase)